MSDRKDTLNVEPQARTEGGAIPTPQLTWQPSQPRIHSRDGNAKSTLEWPLGYHLLLQSDGLSAQADELSDFSQCFPRSL